MYFQPRSHGYYFQFLLHGLFHRAAYSKAAQFPESREGDREQEQETKRARAGNQGTKMQIIVSDIT